LGTQVPQVSVYRAVIQGSLQVLHYNSFLEASNGFILFRMWCIVDRRRALLLRLR
jgi:hypothetical protein